MERRSDKYLEQKNTAERHSRVQKNNYLYEEANNKIGYEEIQNINTDTPIDLSSLNMKNPSRGDYQKIREYKDLLVDKKREAPEEEIQEAKAKNFDINAVLEEAKKNRKAEDELEKKRNIENEEYSVLSTLNKKYLHKKDFNEDDDDELKELIDTITSKTLVDDIKDEEEKELLSDLLATTIDIKLEKELSKEDINNLYSQSKDEEEKELENSFYTESMELSKNDLVSDDETVDDADDNDEGHSGLKIFAILFILFIIVLIVAYFLLKHFGIAFN